MSPFSDNFKPVLDIEVIFVNDNGEVLWSERERISHRNDETPVYAMNEYMQNPEYLQEALSKSIDLAVINIMKKIN